MIEPMGEKGLGIDEESNWWMRLVNNKLDEIIARVNQNSADISKLLEKNDETIK